MRTLALATVVFLSASPAALAVLVTGRAMGTVTLNGSPPRPGAYQFTPGEAVFLTFEYDTERATQGGGTATQQSYFVQPWTFRVTTGGGFVSGATTVGQGPLSPGFARVVNGPTDSFFLSLSYFGVVGIDLTFTDPTGAALSSTALPTLEELLRFPGGTLDYGREFQDLSFRSTVAPVADFSVPEPGTFVLGAIGVGLLGLATLRRRKAA